MAGHGPEIVDLMPAFWAFEDARVGPQSAAERAERFRELVMAPHMNIYGLGEFRAEREDAGLAHYLEQVEPYLPQMRSYSAEVQTEVAPAETRFLSAFPDFDGRVTVAFLPSLGHFDGQTLNLMDGRLAVLFGIDGIARFHGADADLGVLFSHELFHAYHDQVNPKVYEDETLYTQLWAEGLATYVSMQLNPGSSESTALLDPKLAAADPVRVPEMARAFLSKFDSRDKGDYREFFQFDWQGPFPPRGGYLLGLRVCEVLGRKYSLQQLAKLGGDELREQIRAALETLAAEPKTP